MIRLARLGCIFGLSAALNLIPLLNSRAVRAESPGGPAAAAADGIRVRLREIEQRIAAIKPLKRDAERKLASIGNGTLDRSRYNDSRCDTPCNPLLGASACRARDLKAAGVHPNARTCAEIFKSDPELVLVSLDCARAVRKCGTVAKQLDTEEAKTKIHDLAQEYLALEDERRVLNRELARAQKKPLPPKEESTERSEKPENPASAPASVPFTPLNAEPAKD